MSVPKVNTVVWLYHDHAEELRRIARKNARAERAWLAEQREALHLNPSDPTPEELRTEVLRLRPDNWPGESHMVEAAMRVRLSAPDLAGPWAPFSATEVEAQRLSGRRVGSPNRNFSEKMAFDLAADVVDAARLAAHRVSEPIIATMRAEKLIGPCPRRSRHALARKQELQAQVYTVGRIVREAIATITGL
ncbi:hypothetical protein [Streptomyces atacamensis]|uniref:hypothetical protein n=1 Tax=Streptomyces atacamensis TaxID=531966 RepID=UPI00399D439E